MFTNLADPYVFNKQKMKVLYLFGIKDYFDPTQPLAMPYTQITSYFPG